MGTLKAAGARVFDIRQGERGRTLFMSLYLLFAMFAYYVLKPVSRAMFLTEFKVDKLPYLNLLIAGAGGALAYFYSRFAARTSLKAAVRRTMSAAAVCLLGFWWLTGLRLPWMLYVFNVWVSLFSAVLISQGWLVAANLFDTRSAKRVYGVLGLGAVLGAAFGGAFTALTARLIGTKNLLPAAAVLVGLAYAAFRSAIAHTELSSRTAASDAEAFRFRDILLTIGCSRHLKLIVTIFGITFVVSTLVDFQFQAMAAARYQGDRLAAFFGTFQGIYVNALTFPLQFLLTAAVVRIIGVGGTLQIMPVSVAAASSAILLFPGLGSAAAAELSESASRYTVNRTAMELLYLPLPPAVRNRTKAFVDVFVDRVARGLGGALLAILLAVGMRDIRQIAVLSLALCCVWIFLCALAAREYMRTVRGRLCRRRLDLDDSRVNVNDPATLALLEQTAAEPNARQACYAIGLLAEAPHYDIGPLLVRLSTSPLPEVRAKTYEAAWFVGFRDLLARALEELESARAGERNPALRPAVDYVLSFATDAAPLAARLIRHPNATVAESALQMLQLHPGAAHDVITAEWIAGAAADPAAERRRLAALAIRLRPEAADGAIEVLLRDSDPGVVGAACLTAAAASGSRHVRAIVGRLAEPFERRYAIEALASLGGEIVATVGGFLEDDSVPIAVRRQIPRVLRLIPSQLSVDVLMRHVGHPDVSVRAAVLKALNRLREKAPELNYAGAYVAEKILAEARHYCELHAALAPIAGEMGAPTATGLLARTIKNRAEQAIERVFRLLGLCYAQRDIHASYDSLRRNRGEEAAAALEFLENVLDRSLGRVLVPLLESSGAVVEKAHSLFGIEVRGAEAAVAELIRSGDAWLVACAVATAAEQGFTRLLPDIDGARRNAGGDVVQVALAAAAKLGC